MTSKIDKKSVEEMIRFLTSLNILEEKESGSFRPFPEFDMLFRGHLARLIRRNPEPTQLEIHISQSMIETLNDYGFFNAADKTEKQVELAVDILREFIKEGKVESLLKMLGR